METFTMSDIHARMMCFEFSISDVTDFLDTLHKQDNKISITNNYNPDPLKYEFYTAFYEDYVIYFLCSMQKIIARKSNYKPEFEPNPPPKLSSKLFEPT